MGEVSGFIKAGIHEESAVDTWNRMVDRWRGPTPRAKPPKRIVEHATFAEIAAELKVSHQAVQQIERRALRKCRRWCAQHGLRLTDLLG